MKIPMSNYDIVFAELNQFEAHIKSVYAYRKLFIVTDETVFSFYQNKVKEALSDFEVSFTVISPGETSKAYDTYVNVISDLINKGLKREHMIVALGGGVVGDLAGFVAATIYRGVPFIQIPTTLLAMADSSIGGKTGIDLDEGKNLVGAFYTPKIVLIDMNFLKTLSPAEYRNGMAEVIKAGLIGNKSLYVQVRRPVEINAAQLKEAILVKKAVVDIDPFDKKERMFLNFGHTFGHAIEKHFNYNRYKHGEAISYGMLIAIELGISLDITPSSLYDEVKGTLLAWQLINEPVLEKDRFTKYIKTDKKYTADGFHFILLKGIGKPVIKQLQVGEET